MNPTASRFLTSTSLMVWGVMLLYFYFSRKIVAYLHPAFHGWTLVSGLVLVALAVGILLFSQSRTCREDAPSKTGAVFSFVILTAPLIAAVGISPNGFGAATIANRGLVQNINELPAFAPPAQTGTKASDSSDSFIPKNEKGEIKLETVDLLYATAEPSMREDFENKEIEVVGQFVPARTGNPNGDRFNLVRLFVTCCAADARPVGVAVQSKETFPEMSWVKVTGKATFPVEAGRRSALIVADRIEPTEQPPDSFLTN